LFKAAVAISYDSKIISDFILAQSGAQTNF